MNDLFEKVKNSENHLELINGVEIIQNKTSTSHNIAVTEIALALKNHIFANNGKCKVDEDGVHTAPLFVAEVTSESTKSNDYGYKKEIYKSMGVEEYWIVDIQRGLIEKHLLSKGYIPDCYIHPEAMKVTVYDFVTDVSSFMR